MLWVEKYSPKDPFEIEGHEKEVSQINDFIKNYKKGALLIYGPTGSGKTCSVYALARELDVEILEVNSSNVRNKERINAIVRQSSQQRSLFDKPKLILIDDIDALSGRKDRGCIQALIKIISDTKFPIILTVEDPYTQKLSSLRRKCQIIDFSQVETKSIFNVLKKICENEKIQYKEEVLKDLARRSGTDFRSAINDLQILCTTKKVIDSLEGLGEREQKDSILNALKIIFKSKNPSNVLNAFNKTDLDLDECLLWLDENLPKEYQGRDLHKAYNFISRADVFKGRIRRWQHWRFLVYINSFLTAGVALAKEKKSDKVVDYKQTTRILKLWKAKMKYGKRKAIAEKIALNTHTSTKRVLNDTLPYLNTVFKKRKGNDMINELELTEEEVGWLSQ